MLFPYLNNRLFKVYKWVSDSSHPHGTNPREIEETTDLREADIVTSEYRHTAEYEGLTKKRVHSFMVDLDVPATLVPSSTPGHNHLYIDVFMTWEDYREVLDALAKVGILETGYVNASKARGFTAVRLPWVNRNQAKD